MISVHSCSFSGKVRQPAYINVDIYRSILCLEFRVHRVQDKEY
mgnify:FL=1